MGMDRDPDEEPRLPEDFGVDDILGAPIDAREPAAGVPRARPVRPEDEARGALWELDFALQELEWLSSEREVERELDRDAALVGSIAGQIRSALRSVRRAPSGLVELSDGLREELAERFERLTDAIERMPPGWAGHDDVQSAYARLRAELAARGVEVE